MMYGTPGGIVVMLGGDVAYLCWAINVSLGRFVLREEIDRGHRWRRGCIWSGAMFGFQKPVALHFGVFADVMFLA